MVWERTASLRRLQANDAVTARTERGKRPCISCIILFINIWLYLCKDFIFTKSTYHCGTRVFDKRAEQRGKSKKKKKKKRPVTTDIP